MTTPATLRAAAAIVEAAAAREGRAHWEQIAADLNTLADEIAPEIESQNSNDDTERGSDGAHSDHQAVRFQLAHGQFVAD